ncbi:unnamed protein product [Lactuca virosa]|uniref:Uncharacterized protein n=1 Tax=Lactuca virosa TaxID=75947 RepID=A0AAU9MFD9_9ASTR|nr:unnamed protein product [Lactuca virosa]
MAEVAVVEALLFGDDGAKAAATEAVIHLTNKQRHKLADNGAIPPLVSMLHNPPDFKSLESALFALLSLAYGSERNKIRIAKSGAIPLFLNLIRSQIHPLIDHAIAALLILSSCSSNKPSMATSGAIETLNQTLLQNSTTQVKLDIIVTLHNLSPYIPAFLSSSTSSSLIHLIHESEKSSKLVEKSMCLLEHLSSSSEIALRAISSTEIGIRAVVESVEEGSKQCKEYAVGILLMICESSRERYRGMILCEGAIPGLLQVSLDGTRRAKGSAKSLLRLLRDCESGGGERLKNIVVEEVMGEIYRGGTEVGMVEEMIARLTT